MLHLITCHRRIMPRLAELLFLFFSLPALVAQLDARQTGDQEVAGLTPTRLATFFRRV